MQAFQRTAHSQCPISGVCTTVTVQANSTHCATDVQKKLQWFDLLAHKGKEVSACGAGVGQVVLFASCEHLFQCSIELVFLLVLTCSGAALV